MNIFKQTYLTHASNFWPPCASIRSPRVRRAYRHCEQMVSLKGHGLEAPEILTRVVFAIQVRPFSEAERGTGIAYGAVVVE